MEPVKRKSHDLEYIGEREIGGEVLLRDVGNLPCQRVRAEDGSHYILSHWKPSPEELAVLNDGGVVELGIYHEPIPPVSVAVAGPEEPEAEGDND